MIIFKNIIDMLFKKQPTIQSKTDNQIITQDEKVAKLLIEKTGLIKDGRAISEDIEKLENDRNKVALRVQKIKDKIIPFAKKIKKDQLGRYEDIQSIDLIGEDIVLTTFDYIQEYKKQLEIKINKGQL